ncbi:MAG: serine/threonine-protein kinase [Polyangiaceae bacterium]
MATVHIGRLLGADGFSRTVAIKRMHPHLAEDAEFCRMFVEEAHIAARVQHANVVSTLDVVREGRELFHVMEYVDGDSFARVLGRVQKRGAQLPLDIVGGIVVQMLSGLHAVHEARGEDGKPLGLIHRDVSPDNILIGRDGVARVLDFGIAKATELGRRTQVGKIKGKVAYMAPEHIRGKDVDRRADVYAAAAVLWEALVGRRLVDGASDLELIHSALHLKPSPPSQFVPGLSPQIDAVVMKGLAANAADRFQTAREMANAVERELGTASPSSIASLLEAVLGVELEQRAERVSSAVRRAAEMTGAMRAAPTADIAMGASVTAAGNPAFGTPPAASFSPTVVAPNTGAAPRALPPATTPTTGPTSPSQVGTLVLELPSLPSLDVPGAPPAPPPPPPGEGGAPPVAAPTPPRPVASPPAAPPPEPGGLPLDVDFGAPSPRPPTAFMPATPPPSADPRSSQRGGAPSSGPAFDARPEYASGDGFATRGALKNDDSKRGLIGLLLLGGATILILVIGVVIVVRSNHRTTKPSGTPTADPAAAATACDTMRRRVRSGGASTGLARDGWLVELWLRGAGGAAVDSSKLDLLSLSGADPASVAVVDKLSGAGDTTQEGTLIRLTGPVTQNVFDQEESLRLIKASDLAFEQVKAEAGALYLRCAHLSTHEFALWFRGRDIVATSSAMLVALAAFSDSPIVRSDSIGGPDTRGPTLFDRFVGRFANGKSNGLDLELQRFGATVDDMGTRGGIRVTFPVERVGDSVRATRAVADKAGIEQR